MNVSRYAIVGYGVFMGVIAIILNEIGLNLGWVYLFMGIIIGSAVFPIYACLTWNKTSATAAIAGTRRPAAAPCGTLRTCPPCRKHRHVRMPQAQQQSRTPAFDI